MDRLDKLEQRIERIEDHLGLDTTGTDEDDVADANADEAPGDEPDEEPSDESGRTVNTPYGSIDADELDERQAGETNEEPAPGRKLLAWLIEHWVLNAGGLMVVLASIWFVSSGYFTLGPAGRVVVTLMTGFGFMGAALRLRDHPDGAGIVLSIGTIIALSGSYMAVLVYGLLGIVGGVVLAFSIIAAHAALSVLHKFKNAAIVAPFLIGLLPIAVDLSKHDPSSVMGLPFSVASIVFFLATLTPLMLGAFRRRYPAVLSTSLVTVIAYSGYFADGRGFAGWMVLLLTVTAFEGFFVLFAQDKTDGYTVANALLVAVGTVTWSAMLLVDMPIPSADPGMTSPVVLTLLLFGATFAVVAAMLSEVSTTAGVAAGMQTLVMIVAATAFAFDGPALQVAFATEAAVGFIGAAWASRYRLALGSLLVLGAIVYSQVQATLMHPGEMHLLAASLISASAFLSLAGLVFVPDGSRDLYQLLRLVPIGIVYASVAALIWTTSFVISNDAVAARGLALGIYSLIGIVLVLAPDPSRAEWSKMLGQLTFALVAARLLLVEAWAMPTPYRIVTFLVIGLILVGYATYNRIGT